jgi:ribonuclease P protein component
MLDKKFRLRKRKQFNYIYNKGDKSYSKSLTLVYTPTKIQPPKFGIVVNNKIGKAVTRNSIKRKIRECIRLNTNLFSSKNNYILIAKSGIEKLSYDDILKDIKYTLKKAGLLIENN